MKSIDKMYINGEFITSGAGGSQKLYDPSTGSPIGHVQLADQYDADAAVAAAASAFSSFSRTGLHERSEILKRIYSSIMAREDDLNKAAVLEYGSPVTATISRTRFAAQLFLEAEDAMNGFDFQKQLPFATIVREPLGVIAAITPWNANYTHICGKIAPAIATGCTVVIKPSESSALQTQILMECIDDARVPSGVINMINGTGDVVGAALTRHPDIALVTFTGSTEIGKVIRKAATDTMKRVVLELGGKSPNIILDDADLQKAVPLALAIAFSNSGQACHAGTRLLVHEKQLEKIKELLVREVSSIKIGDLWNPDSFIGPMVSKTQYDTVQQYIRRGIAEGAKLLYGGLGHPDGFGGYYVKPTIFTDVKNNMRVAQEEIFGPVLSVISYSTDQEAIEIANDTIYGLSAYISSADMKRARHVAASLISGRVLINTAVNREIRSPFGGFKESGIGRTSHTYSLEEYVEEKVIAF